MAEEKPKREIIVNPDEPSAGNYAFDFYNDTKPVGGDSAEISRARKALRGLGGKRVTMLVKGQHIDAETGKAKKFRVSRTFTLNRYSDAFGPGSALLSAVKYVKGRYSEDELDIMSIEFEEAEPGEEDYED